MKSPKKAKIPTNTETASGIGNSQINGFASQDRLGLQNTYPINNFMGMNYSKPVKKNTDINLTASLDLNKEGMSTGFNPGLRRTFPDGGVIESSTASRSLENRAEAAEEDPLLALSSGDVSKFMYDSRKNSLQSDTYKTFEQNVEKCGNGKGCAEGAFNYWANEVSPYLHQPGIRDIHNQYVNMPEDAKLENPQYSVKSRGRHSYGEHLHNNSIDSWELYNIYNKTDAGNVLWDGKSQGKFEYTPENFKNIPIGAIITQGRTEGSITEQGNPQSSHTTTVVGFDHDGHPLVYDSGEVHRLGESNTWGYVGEEYQRVNDIFVPKGYDNFTYDKMKTRALDYDSNLGYVDKEGNPITDGSNKYSRSYINDIKNSLDSNEAKLGKHYNISKGLMDKIQNRVIGIGAQESNLNNFGDIKEKNPQGEFKDHDSAKQRWLDNATVNSLVKPLGKKAKDAWRVYQDEKSAATDDREQLADWEVDILTEDKLNEEGTAFKYGDNTWNTTYNDMREQYAEPRLTEKDLEGKEYKSSRGPFKIKDFPEAATRFLKDSDGEPLDKGDLQIGFGGDVDELRNGANVATIHIAESYNRMKEKYNKEKDFDLTEDQLLDLATIAYNNGKKSMSEKFVNRFIKSDTLRDQYLTNVKRYEKLYLEKEELQQGESTSDDRKQLPTIDQKNASSSPGIAPLGRTTKTGPTGWERQAYGGIIPYGNGGAMMPYMYPQQMKGGGQFWSKFGAGATGALQGVAGSLLPGQIGDMAVKGIGAVHGMIDQDVTAEDQAIMGGARAVGAGVTAVATGGASLAAGADDMVVGTKDAVKHGTEWGQKNAGALDAVGGIAATAAGGAAGGAADGGGMKGAGQGLAQAFGMPGGANAGGTPGITGDGGNFTGQLTKSGNVFTGGTKNTNMDNTNNIMGMLAGQGGGQGGMDPQQMMNLAKQFGLMGYGGPLQMAQGGFKPHPMYKDGQMVMANDHATHLSLKKQGYGHKQMMDGGLMSIENGGAHEQNPMGGVPVGPTASVEEGETIMDLVEGGKFVFSDRKGPKGKRGSTWADMSKRVERKYKDREGDAAAKRAMDQELLEVAEKQEAQKAKEMAKLQAKMGELSGEPAGMPPMMPPQSEMAPPPQMGMPDPGMMQQPQQGMPPGMPPMMGMGGKYYGNGGRIKYNHGGPHPGQIPEQAPMMDPNMMQPNMMQQPQMGMMQMDMTQQPQTGEAPMHQMPDGSMMPGATHQDAMNMGAYGYGGKVRKYGMGGPMLYPGGGMIPYGHGGMYHYKDGSPVSEAAVEALRESNPEALRAMNTEPMAGVTNAMPANNAGPLATNDRAVPNNLPQSPSDLVRQYGGDDGGVDNPSLMSAIDTSGLDLGQTFAPTVDQIQQGVQGLGQITGLNPAQTPAWQNELPFEAQRNIENDKLNAQQAANNGKIYSTNTGEEINMAQNDWQNQLTPEADAYQKQRNLDAYNKEVAQLDSEAAARQKAEAEQKRVRNRNLGIAGGALANSAGDIYNLAQGLRGAEDIKYDRVNSEEIDLHAQRQALKRQGATGFANTRKSFRRAGDLSNVITANAAITGKVADGLAKSYSDEFNTNVGIRNKDKVMNQAIDTAEQTANQKAKAAKDLLVSEGLHGVGANTAGAMLDVRKSNQVDKNNANQLNSMNEIWKNFKMGPDGKLTWKG